PDGARGRGRHDARGAPARDQGRDALFGHPLGRVRPRAATRRDGAGRHRAGGRLPDPVPRHLEPPRPRLRRGPGARLQPMGRGLLQRGADARKLGHVGVFLRPNPNQEGSWFCDGSYDRLWAAFQDLDLAVGFHPYLMPDMPGAVRQLGLHNFLAPGAKSIMEMTAEIDTIADGTYGNRNIFFTQALGNVVDMQIALTMLICGGVLERFPRLRCIFLEANGGWIVPILERLDHHYEIFRWEVPQLKMKPSEYFKRQCWISFDPDESTLRLTAETPVVGADRIIWASDYPHPDAKIPGVVGELRHAMEGLGPDAQARILGLNAVELYGLPAPA